MSAISYQVNMNNFLSLLVGASLVAANSSPSHDMSQSQPSEFSNGVSSFALPAEDRMPIESYTMAVLNYSYMDTEGHQVELGGNESAKYGEGRILSKTGILVHVTNSANHTDHTGCSIELAGTRGEPLPYRHISWIALIQRGSCNFEDKVKHAYEHGAAGVIIYNDKDDVKLDKMKINDKERNITAVFTTKAMGYELIEIMESRGREIVMQIIEGSRQFRTIANINRTSVLFVSISFIVLMIISLVWLVFYYVQRFRYLQTKDKQSKRLCSVAKRIIAKIPTKSIKSDDKEIENDCCAICIEPYKVTDLIRVLPCKHEFHKACIDPWLLEHRTCPMCKMDILKHYGFVFTGSQESILQLDMDMEEGDLIDDQSSMEGGYHRRNSVSPLPQIRASSENQMSRSSTESDLEDRVECVPSLSPDRNLSCQNSDGTKRTQEASQGRDICDGCLAAALITNQRNLLNDDTHDEMECDACDIAPHGSKSLPTTLKKYKGNHFTGSCRGINPSKFCPTYSSEVIHDDSEQCNCEENHRNLGQHFTGNVCGTHSRLPLKFYKPDRGQLRKVRTPLKNCLPQSISAPSNNEDSIRACVHQNSDQFMKSIASEQKNTEDIVFGNGKLYSANAKRRCSLSRDVSCSTSERQNTVTCADLKRAIDYSNDEDISDETEPNSDNDLIVRRSDRETDKGNRKK